MPVMQEVQEAMGNSLGGGKNAIAFASSGLFVVGSAFKAFAKVSEGEIGIRTSMGRATRTKDAWLRNKKAGELYGIVGPGYHLMMPFTHSVRTISVQNRTYELGTIQIDCDAEKQIGVESSIIWRVREDGDNPYKALFNVDNSHALSESVANICTAGLRSVLDGRSESWMKNHVEVDNLVKEHCGEDLLQYGTELKRINIKTVTRTFGQMILEASMGPNQTPLGAMALPEGVAPLHVAN